MGSYVVQMTIVDLKSAFNVVLRCSFLHIEYLLISGTGVGLTIAHENR